MSTCCDRCDWCGTNTLALIWLASKTSDERCTRCDQATVFSFVSTALPKTTSAELLSFAIPRTMCATTTPTNHQQTTQLSRSPRQSCVRSSGRRQLLQEVAWLGCRLVHLTRCCGLRILSHEPVVPNGNTRAQNTTQQQCNKIALDRNSCNKRCNRTLT